MLSRNQEQTAANGGTAIQAGRDVTITSEGLSYREVRDVALDVFRANFCKLAGLAKDIARARAEEITEEFLSRLQEEYPTGLQKAHDPDFQYALFTIQREYARNGDRELGDLLVDLFSPVFNPFAEIHESRIDLPYTGDNITWIMPVNIFEIHNDIGMKIIRPPRIANIVHMDAVDIVCNGDLGNDT